MEGPTPSENSPQLRGLEALKKGEKRKSGESIAFFNVKTSHLHDATQSDVLDGLQKHRRCLYAVTSGLGTTEWHVRFQTRRNCSSVRLVRRVSFFHHLS